MSLSYALPNNERNMRLRLRIGWLTEEEQLKGGPEAGVDWLLFWVALDKK